MERPVLCLALLLMACGGEGEPSPSPTPAQQGALVGVTLESRVGVVLDELPDELRGEVSSWLRDRPSSFWEARAAEQLHLSWHRLTLRAVHAQGKGALPLPPEPLWQVSLVGSPSRGELDGHDVVLVPYTFKAVLVADPQQVEASEPSLAQVGAWWEERLTLPLDPVMLFERVGLACANEALWPGGADDSNLRWFYDDTCQVESEGGRRCHLTELPDESCVQALKRHVGHVDVQLHFERLPWDEALAGTSRLSSGGGPGASLVPGEDPTRGGRWVYRFVSPDSCLLDSGCVRGAGWRRLFTFDQHILNVGGGPLSIGEVANLGSGAGGAETFLSTDPCSGEQVPFQVATYRAQSAAATAAYARASCVWSARRHANDEWSPLGPAYMDCGRQGLDVGWSGVIPAGAACQWVDVPPSEGEATTPGLLEVGINPGGLLCEGTLVTGPDGAPLWEDTSYKTEAGEPVQRMQCAYEVGWAADNEVNATLVLPRPGEGALTAPCVRGEVGPLRMCGLAVRGEPSACVAGEPTTLDDPSLEGQVVRVCEASAALGMGTACAASEALWAGVYAAATPPRFVCPPPRGIALEPGGLYSVYQGPVVPE